MNSISHVTSPTPRPPTGPSIAAAFFHVLLCVLWLSPQPVAHGMALVSASGTDSWTAPVSGASEADVVQAFVPPEMPWSAAHRGIDIRTSTPDVLAPAAGEVTFVGTVVDRPVITVRHANGLLSSFEPVASDLQTGDSIEQGAVIGTITEEVQHCDVPCVHWGVRKPDAWQIENTVRDLYLDPAFLLGWTEPSVLWPIDTDPVH